MSANTSTFASPFGTNIPPEVRCIMIPRIIKLIPPELIGGKTYYATNLGEILNADGKPLTPCFAPSLRMTCHHNSTGGRSGKNYPNVKFGGKLYKIHRLVCAAFWGLPAPGQHCHHLDGNGTNNRADNLVWVTPHEHQAFERARKAGAVYTHWTLDQIFEFETSYRRPEC